MSINVMTTEDKAEILAEIRAAHQRPDELTPPQQWVSIKDYMTRHGIKSASTVYRKIEAGELQARGSGKTREVKV